jgi:hypothetical protein
MNGPLVWTGSYGGIFGASFTGYGGVLNTPLGEWLAQSHRLWEWHYHRYGDTLYQRRGDTILVYTQTATRAIVQSRQEYHRAQDIDLIPDGWVPANVLVVQENVVHRRSVGTPVPSPVLKFPNFWEFLKSLGGEWMWDYIQEGEIDVTWISTALTTGIFIGVTDRSYNRIRTGAVSGSGWIICFMQTRQILRGSFYKTSHNSGLYRGELLGLVALHTLIVAVAKHF